MSDRPRPRKVKASKALEMYLTQMAETCDDVLRDQIDPEAVKWAGETKDPSHHAAYTMGAADAYSRTLEAVRKGLRMWVDATTGEMIGVDVEGDPYPPGY